MRRWIHSKEASRRRHCAECDKRLDKAEAVICAGCYAELLMRTAPSEPTEFQDDEDFGEEEKDETD